MERHRFLLDAEDLFQFFLRGCELGFSFLAARFRHRGF
jgi:hypothetical protein